MERQGALTVIFNVKDGETSAIEDLLEKIGNHIENNEILQFRRSQRTHFARLVLLDGGRRLLFTSNYDGSEKKYLAELRDALSYGMWQVLKHCQGCPDESSFNAKFVGYLKDHSLSTQTFYVAFPNRTVHDIAKGSRARLWLDTVLDKLSDQIGSPSRLAWLVSGDPPTPAAFSEATSERMGSTEKLIDWAVGIKPVRTQPKNMRVDPALVAIEDKPNVVQNQMTVIVNVKPALWSRVLLRIVLWAANLVVKQKVGSLSNISTIHFARWGLIDGGRKLLFESNYDGSWERYIDDFVDRASSGLNAIWGNTMEYPLGGARDIETFKQSIRANQIPAQVFYSAYPQSTVINIFNDLHCADFLEQNLSKTACDIAAGARLFPT